MSRGLLCHPPIDLHELALFLFAYYKGVEDKRCATKVLIAFREIYDPCQYEFVNVDSILRRFANTFTKGFSKLRSEQIKRE